MIAFSPALASVALLGYIAGLGTYWLWVVVEWHWRRKRKFWE